MQPALRRFLPLDPNLTPVPGWETARWRGDPAPLAAIPEDASPPALVAAGETDALLVHVLDGDRAMVQRIRGAFDGCAATVDAPTTRALDDLLAECPGLGPALDLGIHPTAGGAAFVITPSDDGVIVGHRTGPGEAATELGRVASSRVVSAVSTGAETLWLARTGDVPTDPTVDIIRAVLPGHQGAGVFSVGEIECLPGLHPVRVIGRAPGELWLLFEGPAGPAARPVVRDARDGRAWFLPYAPGRPGTRASAAWTSGFAVAVQGDPMVVVVSDGVHTTRVLGDVVGDVGSSRAPALLASRDGSVLLVAYDAPGGPRLARASIGPDPSEDRADPWAVDRASAAPPVPLPAWPPPLSSLEDVILQRALRAQPGILRERYVRQARLRTLLTHLGSVGWPDFANAVSFEGDDQAGHHTYDDGCGDHLAMVWSSAGVVAAVYESSMVPFDRSGIATLLDRWCPERHLARLPPTLQPLGWRALHLAHDTLTACLWIATGTDTSGGASGHGLDMLDAYALTADDVLLGSSLSQTWLQLHEGSEEWARLVMRLDEDSRSSPVTLTQADEMILFESHVRLDREPHPGSGREVARRLAPYGIRWPDPEGAWARVVEARRRARDGTP